ncbi:glycosyltransferase family 2 protein [Sphingobium sp. Cam5-1]|uniref:glycosyltransferase family 2 protein n=1 Tax=Sphingobium sp. Cam5-1 TaxID=2789327 RepID=UPI0018AD1292|nr:glycosyltransferase [Sphingobium sp. Cam5-1]QPI74319.1 glycosyltransferase [Sphingobium sp. Cam5-1]
MGIAVGIFAHQEERRIGTCLASLPLDRADTIYHVLVNGSTDATAARAREAVGGRANVRVHDIAQGGKSRTWNHMIHDLLDGTDEAVILLDGDAQIAPGSIDALVRAVASDGINAAAGMPLNGRMAAHYRQLLSTDGGLFGDLYALSGHFVNRIRARRLRLPNDLIGDDGLVAAWAHTDLQTDVAWQRERVIACEEAGFLCEPVRLTSPASWRMQYRRMTNYSLRFFQNRIVSDIMGGQGPDALPRELRSLYAAWLPRLAPRSGPTGWFDRKALARMRQAAA